MPNYREITFSPHAKDRQKTRGISNNQVLDTISKPGGELPQKRNGRRKFYKMIDGSKLLVIIKELKHEKAIIITTYWDN